MANKTTNSGSGSLPEQMIDMGDGTFAKQMVGAHANYTLMSGVSALGAGPAVGPVAGGDYIWRTEATTWTGVTATLQFLGLDGATWYPVRNAANSADITATANSSVAIGIAQGSVLRVNVTGTAPVGMNSALGGL
ncbi:MULTISPECIES: hypothetical protein [unclassified Rhizobium]|uniref:hypothetical protein n=1 Tax=unclassified Rhizobium TaxID=2613769 RepID=UPI001ADB63BE|nr:MULTISPECIES: hypothetical protein [unclassified Rhizobium]MBO9099431.1 hypothetical protein [Rhizobium sp. L58/93]QXZ87083.1 hypothetical protein J5287_21080 [Rhizobium sp. K1/93]QXZ92883.1 hypothetical protein J5280_19815 [Rhizobium sp. K15/93]